VASPGGIVDVVASPSGWLAAGAEVAGVSGIAVESTMVGGSTTVGCSADGGIEAAVFGDEIADVVDVGAVVVELCTGDVELAAELVADPSFVELEHAARATSAPHAASRRTMCTRRSMYGFIGSSHFSSPGQLTRRGGMRCRAPAAFADNLSDATPERRDNLSDAMSARAALRPNRS